MRALLAAASLATAALLAPSATPAQAVTPVSAVATADPAGGLEAQVIALTNAERAKAGLRPLAGNGCLLPFSRTWVTTLAARGSLAHQDLSPILRKCSLTGTGENVAMGYDSAATVVAAWMASPGHRANILNPAYTQISVAVTGDGAGTRYWGMNLGTGPAVPLPR